MAAKRWVLQMTMLAFLCTGLTAPVQAGVVGTQQYLTATDRQANLATVNAALMREDVQQQLIALGVEPADAMARVASLPDQDVANMAAELATLPAGGDVLAVIGIVFVVLLILELTGVTNIFTNI